jgi:diketogulonate reductase-like aldo/keto reductase
MKVDYLDLYLIHFPISLKYVDPEVRPANWIHDPSVAKPRMEIDLTVTYQETWAAMEELVKEGLVKNIGVSNVGCDKLQDILKYAKVKPAVLQVEMHPHLSQDRLLRFAQMNGVQVMAYSQFGKLSTSNKQVEADKETSFLHKEELVVPAKKYGKSAG